MANVAALKKKAAEFEAKKQIDKAIAAYREVLDAYDSGDDPDPDVALYNRVGDLLTRQGNTAEAVALYERAVDLYSEGGFFNNAIALCNKVLRTSPGRASVYYKLGKISAAKGFKGEAKQNFLEYADRMQKAGKIDEAFRALKEFAELVPDQDDVRLMLAEQLTKAGKNTEALDQLQILYGRYEADGRAAEAQATADRMMAIDPAFEPKASEAKTVSKDTDDLIFIDLDAPVRRSTRIVPRIAVPPEPATVPPPPAPVADLELMSTSLSDVGLASPVDSGNLLGLETTSLAEAEPEDEGEPLAPEEFAEMDLTAITEARPEREPAGRDLALGGELPVIDIESRASGAFAVPGSDAGGGTNELTLLDLGTPAGGLEVVPTSFDSEPASGVDLAMLDVGESHRPAKITGEIIAVTPDDATSFDAVTADVADEPPPPVRRSSALVAANSVMSLRIKLEDSADDPALRRQLGEALLEDGEREEGIRELELALAGFDKANDIDSASSVADEIVRVNPLSVRYHQKRVEYAFRANDKPRTAEAYLALADALFRDGQSDRARAVYERVLEILPDDARAKEALKNFLPAASTPAGVPAVGRSATPPKGRRYTGSVDSVPARASTAAPGTDGDDEFVSLGDWLREDEGPKSTRMVVAEEEPTGDEQADFADMLKKFRQGISENVEEEDHESHYDLGVAFKEMGLVDEAISEFQKALRGTQKRARTFEALGQCFLEKKQLPVATTILTRALNEPGIGDEQLVGVLYLLGYIHEALAKPAEAKGFYERVFAVDIQFRDVGERLNAVDKAVK